MWVPEGFLYRLHWFDRLGFITIAMSMLYLFAGSGEPFYYFQF